MLTQRRRALSQPERPRALSKTECKIIAVQEHERLQKEKIQGLDAELSKVDSQIRALRSKWSSKSDVLRLQLLSNSPLWSRSESEMNFLFKKKSELTSQIEQEREKTFSPDLLSSPGSAVYLQQACLMEQLGRAGSFKPVSPLVEKSPSDDQLNDDSLPDDEEPDSRMFFQMDDI